MHHNKHPCCDKNQQFTSWSQL